MPIKELSLDAQANRIRRAWREQHQVERMSGNGEVYLEYDYDNAGWVQEVFADHVILQSNGDLFRVPYGVDADGVVSFGEPAPVQIAYVPKARLFVFKDNDDRWRYVGWVSNKFRDKDTPPEILSEKAHQNYIERVEATGVYPELWIWHIPGTKVGKADWIDYDDGFLIVSGQFDDDAADVAARIAKSIEDGNEWTMSHGFVRLKFDKKDVVTDDYFAFEDSITPAGVEANPFTRFTTLKEVAPVLNAEKRAKLVELLGEDRVKAIEAGTQTLKAAAEAAGVDFKSVDVEEPETQDQQAVDQKTAVNNAPVDVKELASQLVGLLQLKELSEFVGGLDATLKTLQQRVDAIEGNVKALKESDDQKIAQALTPKAADFVPVWGKAASQSGATVLKDGNQNDQALKDSAPKQSALATFLGGIAGQ